VRSGRRKEIRKYHKQCEICHQPFMAYSFKQLICDSCLFNRTPPEERWAREYLRCVGCGTTRIKHIAEGLCSRCYRKIQKTPQTSGKKWAQRHDCCVKCGTKDVKHVAKGLCVRCYRKHAEAKHRQRKSTKGLASKMLTKRFLIEIYVKQRKSIEDIADTCCCSRSYVLKKMKEYNIPRRSRSSARKLALIKGKIQTTRINRNGLTIGTTYQIVKYNTKFFSKWSNEMAYVLGTLYTDGCLCIDIRRSKSSVNRLPRLSMGQKSKELLRKVLSLMNCSAKLQHHKRIKYKSGVAGELYSFNFDCTHIYSDLIRLGLHPKKSTDISFPDIPKSHVRHFLRGCWDGDGSVYIDKRRSLIHASFVSGSHLFIDGMLRWFEKIGFSKRKVYVTKRKNLSYSFRFNGSQCIRLFHWFYDNVPPEQYLLRKYQMFVKGIGRQEMFRQMDIQF